MPKENVDDMVTTGFRAEVGWSSAVPGERDGLVQVATTNEASTFRLDDEPITGWYITLNREGCNRMIRALRRARDAAYGTDA